jgi:iron complex transport system permease protein
MATGSVFIPPTELWHALTGTAANETFRTILWDIRLPRTILIALVGAALAGSGATYQGLFRNPLADPYLIGVASGAGLGAIIAMSVNWPYTTLGLLAVPLAAFIGSLLTVYLVYTFAHIGRTVPTTNLILAGVAVSSFATSITTFLMLRSTGEVRRAIGWLLGGVSLVGWDVTLALVPYLAIGRQCWSCGIFLEHPQFVTTGGKWVERSPRKVPRSSLWRPRWLRRQRSRSPESSALWDSSCRTLCASGGAWTIAA